MRKIVVLALVTLAPNGPVLGQGSLTPPGPPAAIMKSLDQIRSSGVPINATNTPGDADYHHIISLPGSYFLTGNLGVTKPNGIRITVPNVTVDLNNFRISRGSGTGGIAIRIDATADNCVVKEGTIRGFDSGVIAFPDDLFRVARGGSFLHLLVANCGRGLEAGARWRVDQCTAHENSGNGMLVRESSSVSNCVASENQGIGIIGDLDTIVSNCTARDNDRGGIEVDRGSLVTKCVATGNARGTAISLVGAIDADGDSTISDCVATFNSNNYGIYAGPGSTIINCTAGENRSSSTKSYGIFVDDNSTVVNCTATANQTSQATPTEAAGIYAGSNSTVRNCTAQENQGHGIQVVDRAQVHGCTTSDNGSGTAGAGITGGLSVTVKDCATSQNFGNGISLGSGALVQHSTASQNDGNGILVTDAGLVSDCAVYQNGKRSSQHNAASDGIEIGARNRVLNCTVFSNAQHGIHSTSGNNRNYIEGSLLHGNTGFAIALQGNGNTVIKNQVGGNTGGGINHTGGNIAPVQNASDAVGSIHPLANFQ